MLGEGSILCKRDVLCRHGAATIEAGGAGARSGGSLQNRSTTMFLSRHNGEENQSSNMKLSEEKESQRRGTIPLILGRTTARMHPMLCICGGRIEEELKKSSQRYIRGKGLPEMRCGMENFELDGGERGVSRRRGAEPYAEAVVRTAVARSPVLWCSALLRRALRGGERQWGRRW